MGQAQIGAVVGRLTILKRVVLGWRGSWWVRCECGTEKEMSHDQLSRGRAYSCGCVKSWTTHGHFVGGKSSLTRTSWQGMMTRCFNPAEPAYPRYGGAGITVCERWKKFENFLEDMGERPSKDHSIDRWPDKAGGYEKSNCRWATRREQQNNQKSNRIFHFRGKDVTLAELVDLTGMTRTVLKYRLIEHGWDIERAVTTPADKRHHNVV